MTARPEVVDYLANEMLDTLVARSDGTSADEMFCAVLTVTNRMMLVLLRLGADPDGIKVGLNVIANQIPSDSRVVH